MNVSYVDVPTKSGEIIRIAPSLWLACCISCTTTTFQDHPYAYECESCARVWYQWANALCEGGCEQTNFECGGVCAYYEES